MTKIKHLATLILLIVSTHAQATISDYSWPSTEEVLMRINQITNNERALASKYQGLWEVKNSSSDRGEWTFEGKLYYSAQGQYVDANTMSMVDGEILFTTKTGNEVAFFIAHCFPSTPWQMADIHVAPIGTDTEEFIFLHSHPVGKRDLIGDYTIGFHYGLLKWLAPDHYIEMPGRDNTPQDYTRVTAESLRVYKVEHAPMYPEMINLVIYTK
jgi:hypothetical protein